MWNTCFENVWNTCFENVWIRTSSRLRKHVNTSFSVTFENVWITWNKNVWITTAKTCEYVVWNFFWKRVNCVIWKRVNYDRKSVWFPTNCKRVNHVFENVWITTFKTCDLRRRKRVIHMLNPIVWNGKVWKRVKRENVWFACSNLKTCDLRGLKTCETCIDPLWWFLKFQI